MGMRSFEVTLAKDLGISAAVVYGRFYDLVRDRAKVHADYHDGHFWVRIPYKDFPRVFPYLSAGTVSKAIRKLRDEGLVMVGHYDESGVPVNWYTVI